MKQYTFLFKRINPEGKETESYITVSEDVAQSAYMNDLVRIAFNAFMIKAQPENE